MGGVDPPGERPRLGDIEAQNLRPHGRAFRVLALRHDSPWDPTGDSLESIGLLEWTSNLLVT